MILRPPISTRTEHTLSLHDALPIFVNLPFNFDQLGARQDNAALLVKAGVRVAVGQAGGAIHANYNAGMGLREGAGIAVANGLPYIEALRAVTVNPLAIWGRGGGALTPGAAADLASSTGRATCRERVCQ